MKISILLPYKENFSSQYAGAVSLFLKDTVKISKFKKKIKIFGNTNFKKDLLTSNYINLSLRKFFFESKSNKYLKNFLNYEKENLSDIIEVHNRPRYINTLHKYNKNLVLYYHNDPLNLKDSKTVNDRLNLIKKTKKIIFISKWVKKRFLVGLDLKKIPINKFEIIQHCTTKKKLIFKNKKKIILFVGRLNKSKGYDVFGESVINILNNFKDWKSVVIGDEPREKIYFKHKNLKILGFQNYSNVLKWFKKSDICVVCSRWEEPFGRTALEASSAGCAVITTQKGGLTEASPKSLKINNLTVKNLENCIKKLVKNDNFKRLLQRKIYKHFYLSNTYISNKIDNYRSKIIRV
ncbi:MAG: glycosyltransferase family 4 protein [Candidatus Pelagibacter sp.]